MIALAESGMSTLYLLFGIQKPSGKRTVIQFRLSPMMFSRTGKFRGSMAR